MFVDGAGPLRLTGAHSAAQNGFDALSLSGSGEAPPHAGGVQQLADDDGSVDYHQSASNQQ